MPFSSCLVYSVRKRLCDDGYPVMLEALSRVMFSLVFHMSDSIGALSVKPFNALLIGVKWLC